MSERSARAVASYRGTTPEILVKALNAEAHLAECLKGRITRLNSPVDVIIDGLNVGVEVKTLHISDRADGPQVHMNKRAKERKRQYAADHGLRLFTVAIDLRDTEPRYYVREGIGSFRLSSMRVRSF